MDLSDVIVPMPGATRVETARSIARGAADRADRRGSRAARRAVSLEPVALRPAPPTPPTVAGTLPDAEVVLIMGLPGGRQEHAARETLVRRATCGSTATTLAARCAACCPRSTRLLASGASRIVLDNTYVSRKSRGGSHPGGRGTRRPGPLHLAVDQRRGRAGQRRLAHACRDTAGCPTPKSCGAAASRTSRRCCRRCSSAISASSNRRTRPKDSRASRSCRSSARRDPSFVNRAVIVWCDGVLLRSRSGQPRALVRRRCRGRR